MQKEYDKYICGICCDHKILTVENVSQKDIKDVIRFEKLKECKQFIATEKSNKIFSDINHDTWESIDTVLVNLII